MAEVGAYQAPRQSWPRAGESTSRRFAWLCLFLFIGCLFIQLSIHVRASPMGWKGQILESDWNLFPSLWESGQIS